MSNVTGPYRKQDRYNSVAIGLHWLIAALIIGMLVVGRWMTGLEVEDPLRFNLTQWHKSFGIAILVLSIFRLLWRKTHQPPPALSGPVWEKKAANITHGFFYILLLALPLSGWLMVSASPLNIPTVLFQTIPWPHLPLPNWPGQNTEQLAGLFHFLHKTLANSLLVLLVLHVGAALRHHIILKDQTLARMSIFTASGKVASGVFQVMVVLAAIAVGLLLINKLTIKPIPIEMATGEVRFTAALMGSDLIGSFSNSEVEIKFDPTQLESSVLNATVLTATMQTGNSQVDGTLSEKDWFDTDNFPQAFFTSQAFNKASTGEITVAGALTIKDTSTQIQFPISLESTDGNKLLKGSFTINRLDYNLGATDQPGEEFAGFNVTIEFSFELE